MRPTITTMDAEWNKIPTEGEKGTSEMLTRNFRAPNILEAAQAVVIIAELATEHGLDNQVSCSIGGHNHLLVILHDESTGAVPESLALLANAIDDKLEAPLEQLYKWKLKK